MRYLKPKIDYTSLCESSKTIELKIKIYKPNGLLDYNSSISTRYSTTSTITTYTGNNSASLSSWGNSTESLYPAGWYRIELWFNDVCLGQKSFEIK